MNPDTRGDGVEAVVCHYSCLALDDHYEHLKAEIADLTSALTRERTAGFAEGYNAACKDANDTDDIEED